MHRTRGRKRQISRPGRGVNANRDGMGADVQADVSTCKILPPEYLGKGAGFWMARSLPHQDRSANPGSRPDEAVFREAGGESAPSRLTVLGTERPGLP